MKMILVGGRVDAEVVLQHLFWWRPSPLLDTPGDPRHAVPKRGRQRPRSRSTESLYSIYVCYSIDFSGCRVGEAAERRTLHLGIMTTV